MVKVITFGVFDYFHYGHLMLLEQAKSLGDRLLVAVQEDGSILKYKPNAKILYTTEQRIRMLSSIRLVDKVVLYRDVDKDIQKFDFDVFAVGEDQTHDGFIGAIAWCESQGKKAVRLHRTEGVSSTAMRESMRVLK